MTDTWLGEIIRRSARLNAGGRAFVHDGRSLTNAEYLARCEALAVALRQRGVERLDRVAILAMNRIEYKEVCGACELTGFIFATANFRLVAAELLHQLRETAPVAMFFESAYAAVIDEIRAQVPSIRSWICFDDPPDWAEPYETFLAGGTGHQPDVVSTIDDLACVIFTSGSTGQPKGCILDSRGLALKAEYHCTDLGITSEDRVLVVMPLFHVGAQSMASAGQWNGAEVHLHRGFDAGEFIRTVERERITIAHLAPTMVQMIVEHPFAATADLSSIRGILYSAAAMPDPVLRRALELFGPVLHHAYGQTEGIVSRLPRHQHRPDGTERERRRLLSVGQPYPGVTVRLIDDEGQDVTDSGTGEIVYRGGATFRGYWNDHVATMATLRDGWVHSGDIGRFDEDGFLYLVDRKKDMIVTGGENVASREVEEALLAHPDVAEVAVIGVPHPRWVETVHAVVVRTPEGKVDADGLIAHCRTLLASYKKPTGVTFAERLPTLANGKIDKVTLRRDIAGG